VPEVTIEAELRTEFGKGAARRTRSSGRVPGVVYGHGAETKHVTLPGHELMLALKTQNALIRLNGLKGGSTLALPKAIQRDAIKGFIKHVDLIEVRLGEKVTVEIAVRTVGDVFSGGLLDQQLVTLAIEAEATQIPDGLDIDVTGMEVGTAVHARDLVLPTGASLVTDPDALVLHVLAAPTAEQMEAEISEETAEAATEAAAGGETAETVESQAGEGSE
jgi:large subunit ribosomal protein L25